MPFAPTSATRKPSRAERNQGYARREKAPGTSMIASMYGSLDTVSQSRPGRNCRIRSSPEVSILVRGATEEKLPSVRSRAR